MRRPDPSHPGSLNNAPAANIRGKEGSISDEAASPPDKRSAAGITQLGKMPCCVFERGGGSSCCTIPVLREARQWMHKF